MKLLAEDKQVFDDRDEWFWPVGAAAVAVAVAVPLVVQHDAVAPPRAAALWVGIAVLPWLADAVLFPIKRVATPIWLFVPVVIGAVVAIGLDPTTIELAPFFLVLLCAEMASRLKFVGGLVVLAAAWTAVLGLEIWGRFDESFIWLVGIALSWAGGFAIHTQLRLMDEMKASQATLAARAVAEERARIAREIHDVVAHTLSVTMLHLTGARFALERGDRDDAIAALLEAERAGRASLADIRSTVNVLAGGDTGTEAPMPTAEDLPGLVEGFRAAGLDVDLQIRGDATAVPSPAGLAVYRIAQESLANVVKHAPGAAATVCLHVDGDGVRLEVADSGNGTVASAGEGRGLVGMKERAELLGGSVRAGPDDPGWVVEASLPGPDTPRNHRCG